MRAKTDTADVNEMPHDGARSRRAQEAANAALDVMLTDAAAGGRRRFVSPGPAVGVAAGLARRPVSTARRVASLGAELSRVAAGRSDLRPGRRDRRFADPAWESSWLFRRLVQTHLAVGETVDDLITDAALDWHRERQARFAAGNVLDALAPSNYPWSNPAVIKETVDQGGLNLVRGARRFADDFPHLPTTVDTTRFAVGESLALTPGSVVLRTDVFELIQYAPQTKEVREVPLLFAPPTINKFYVLDLAPGRSMVEWLLQQGQQVFVISWRNPDAEQGHFDLDTYAAAVVEARDAVAAITGQPTVHLNGACSGGIIGSGALGYLAAEDRLGEIASLSLMVVALDNERAGMPAAFAGHDTATAAVAESARRGYLDGQALAGVFTWLRPNDLVWNYVVNNYLMGKAPPAFDVLHWNQDTVRLAAGQRRGGSGALVVERGDEQAQARDLAQAPRGGEMTDDAGADDPARAGAVEMDRGLTADRGDRVARLEHRRGIRVEVEMALLRVGIAPGDHEHLLALPHQPLGHAPARSEVEHVVLVDRRRREQERHLAHLVGLRRVLDQLEDHGAQHDRAGGEREVLADRELARVDGRGQAREVAQEVPRTLDQVQAALVDALLDDGRVRPGEVARGERVEHVAGREAGLALVAPVELGVGDQPVDRLADGQVGLQHAPEQPAGLPRRVGEAPVTLGGADLRAAGRDTRQLRA